jgi:hypothetical protein
MAYNDAIDHKEWADIYTKLTYWELEIDKTENKSMQEVLETQKRRPMPILPSLSKKTTWTG